MATGRFFDAYVRNQARLMMVGDVSGDGGPVNAFSNLLGIGSGLRFRLASAPVAPDDTSITEPSGNGYAPLAGNNNWINTSTSAGVSAGNAWPAGAITPSLGEGPPFTITNSGGGLRWPEATGSWGTIYALVVCSSAVTPAIGNMLLYWELETPVEVGNEDIFQIDEGELSFTFGDLATYL